MAFVTERDQYRVIDYDRDAILTVPISGNLERCSTFNLQWHDQLVVFEAQEKLSDSTLKDYSDLSWQIFRLEIPYELQNQRAEIMSLIREALDQYGYVFSKNLINAIHVNFLPGMEKVQPLGVTHG